MLDYLLDDMEKRLAPANFKRVHEQEHPRAFGSREIVWAGQQRVLRLTWDGKDEWIILEARPSDGIKWQEVHIERVGRDGLDQRGREVVLAALDRWLFGSGLPAA